MKRRHMVSLATGGVITGAIANYAGIAQTSDQPTQTSGYNTTGYSQTVQWRMAVSFPKSLDIFFSGAELFCQRVSALTEGRFVITPYPPGEIAPALEVLDAVSSQTAECGYTVANYYVNKNPAIAFGSGMPFGLTAQQQNAWLYGGGGLEATRQVYQTFNVINFPAGNTGAQMGGWFQNEITQVQDLHGLKMRVSGLGGQIMTRLGIEVKTVAPDAIVQAILNGELDAVEFVGPYDDTKLGLHKTAPYYYYPSWWQPSESIDAIVALEAWHQLPQQFQKAIEMAAKETSVVTLARFNAKNARMLQRLKADGVELKPFDIDILKTAEQATITFYDELASQNSQFKQLYQPWNTFRQSISQWHQINELSFARFAFPLSQSLST
jgi:TRAP-type mannitol/chloroaromatic compound transport system substrate-binding protein